MTPHVVLLILAAVCFVVAAVPHHMNVRFEWLGAAFVVLAWLT